MMKEYWDIYNKNREKTGRTHLRGTALGAGDYHLVVTALIVNSQGQLLIQQRQQDKSGWPGYWDFSAAGSALAGEDSQQALEREIAEELGCRLDLSADRLLFTWYFPDGFVDFWLVRADLDLKDLTLQASEVQAVRWVNQATLSALKAAGVFIPYFFTDDVFSLIHRQQLHDQIGFDPKKE